MSFLWSSEQPAVEPLGEDHIDFPRPPALADLKASFGDKITAVREFLKEDFSKPENKVYDDDLWILRFLFNPKYTPEQCAERYRKMIAKRRADGLEQISAELIQLGDKVDIKNFPHFEIVNRAFPESLFHATDIYGQPVALQHIGKSDPAYLVSSVSKEQFYLYAMYKSEYMRLTLEKMSNESGRMLQWIQVIDLTGLGLKHANTTAIDIAKNASSQIDQMYKECLGKVLVVNAPRVFSMIWALMKPWIAERTVQKLMLVNATANKDLGNVIEKKSWPKYLGGEQTSGSIAFVQFDENGAC